MKRLFSFLISLFLFGLPHWGCPDDDGVKPQPTNPLQLTVEDVTCTEAFLKISLSASETNRTVTLKRGDSTIISDLRLLTSDTLVIDEGLLPNKTYTYKLVFGEWTASAQATTMDTTSHNWTWQIDTLGTSSSVLYDVAIVSENPPLAYAVGEIHTNETDKFDSTGKWIDPYNVAKWDGKKWELMTLKWDCRLYYPNCGPETMLFSPATSVFALGQNDVWIASGSVHHFNGTNWSEEAGIEGAGGANKIWGDFSVGLYFVGNNGFIAHRNPNGSWQEIESGTTLDIYDIYGSTNRKTVEYEILAVAAKIGSSSDRKILRINNSIVSTLSDYPIMYSLKSVWLVPNLHYYMVGSGIYEKRKLSDSNWKNGPLDITQYYTTSIRGNTVNDVFACGSFGDLLHYNGVNWNSYRKQITFQSGSFTSITLNKNLVIAVGGEGARAVIVVGRPEQQKMRRQDTIPSPNLKNKLKGISL